MCQFWGQEPLPPPPTGKLHFQKNVLILGARTSPPSAYNCCTECNRSVQLYSTEGETRWVNENYPYNHSFGIKQTRHAFDFCYYSQCSKLLLKQKMYSKFPETIRLLTQWHICTWGSGNLVVGRKLGCFIKYMIGGRNHNKFLRKNLVFWKILPLYFY